MNTVTIRIFFEIETRHYYKSLIERMDKNVVNLKSILTCYSCGAGANQIGDKTNLRKNIRPDSLEFYRIEIVTFTIENCLAKLARQS